MLGVILCGGQSSRMGSDKGLLKLEAKTWAQTAVDKISTLQIPVKISVNNRQYAQYASVFAVTDLIPDNSRLSLSGPLLGVLSTHTAYPNEDLFILACDMPLMEAALLRQLHDAYVVNSDADAYVFTNDGEAEPLCGIYKAGALARILALLMNGQLARHSMKYMLDHLSVHRIPLAEGQKQYFRNFNAHAELNGL